MSKPITAESMNKRLVDADLEAVDRLLRKTKLPLELVDLSKLIVEALELLPLLQREVRRLQSENALLKGESDPNKSL